MATISKTGGIALFSAAHVAVTHGSSAFKLGVEIDVANDLDVSGVLEHAYVEAIANAKPATFFIMANPNDSGDEGWYKLLQFDTSTIIAPTEVLSGSEAVGQTVLEVASTTGFAIHDIIYVQGATLADGEWHRIIRIVTNTSITIAHGLANAKVNTDTIWGQAEQFPFSLNVSSYKRLKVDYNNELATTGSNTHIRGTLVRADSIG